ncbi:uncharacterized protein DSM5745_00578 [Aspergillus mulundensis]|uniref:DUF7730 domain-containing protein n=1 Tax=Aspergillus mulundensis TaxID=1810919 RepID=A0A3D8T3X8_9EURO|nr:Uncharacterized protein DSM5745_00578 [Aspergillus mulundensis]RDW93256.1 Uncharacterized protein DSM5745_00578 [Aspergillus mulundensis]
MKSPEAKLERLPGEIRNRLYSYLFDIQRVEISRYMDENTGHSHLTHKLLPPRNLHTQNPTMLQYNKKGKLQTQLCISFVSKQFYQETLCLLYDCTQFVFSNTKCVYKFLNRVPRRAQAAIKHIELHHTMYNEPTSLEHREIKLRSDKNWYSLCEKISLTFKALSVLHVDMWVVCPSAGLEIGEPWSLPLLALSRVGKGKSKGLQFVKIQLRSPRFADVKLEHVARQLEWEMMSPIARQIRDDERIARELAGPVKAGKVMTLNFD